MGLAHPAFIITMALIIAAAWVLTNLIRSSNGGANAGLDDDARRRLTDADRKVDLLAHENDQLVGKIGRLEERIAVLERIATEKEGSTARLADEIDRLRNQGDKV